MKGFSKKNLSIIIYSLLKKELRDNNLNYKIGVCTFKDFEKLVMKTDAPLDAKRRYLQSLDDAIGNNNIEQKRIVIFVDRILKAYKLPEKQLTIGAFSSFHEVRHAMQDVFDEFSYEKFLSDIEFYYTKINEEDYKLDHDSYSSEIGANIYAAKRTVEFLKEFDPDTYEKVKKYIEGIRTFYVDKYYLYDVFRFLNPVVEHIQEKGELPDNPVLKVFFDNDGNPKKISDIKQDENYEKLDKRIVYFMLSSNVFSNKIDSKNQEEVDEMNKALLYTEQVKKNQLKYKLKIEK